MEKQLRCKDCKRLSLWLARCRPLAFGKPFKAVNPGWYACEFFVYKDK